MSKSLIKHCLELVLALVVLINFKFGNDLRIKNYNQSNSLSKVLLKSALFRILLKIFNVLNDFRQHYSLIFQPTHIIYLKQKSIYESNC